MGTLCFRNSLLEPDILLSVCNDSFLINIHSGALLLAMLKRDY